MSNRRHSDRIGSRTESLFPQVPEGIVPCVGSRIEWLRDDFGTKHGTRGTITRARGLGRFDVQTDDGRTVTVSGWYVIRVLPEASS